MLKHERQEVILTILDSEQRVISSDLSKRLNVSEDTIRRDLKDLENSNKLKRVHSGALRIGPPVQHFETRKELYLNLKEELSIKALPFIKPDFVVIIDGGTTNLSLIKHIPLDFKCTIITNSPPIAVSLSMHENIEVIVLGGTLYKESMVNLGISTNEALSKIRADLYIMGTHNIDVEEGISVPTLNEALVKRKMISVSSEVLTIVTPDKFGTISKHIIDETSTIDYIITSDLSEKSALLYQKLKITIVQ